MVKNHEMILYRFYGKFSGEVKLKEDEVTEWKWFSYNDAIKLDLAFDWREVIEILHEKSLI